MLRIMTPDGKRMLGTRSHVANGAIRSVMSRELVWIEQQRFRGFGCSACGWRFKSTGRPTGTSFDQMMRNFELQRDTEFKSHVCGDHLKGQQQEEQKR